MLNRENFVAAMGLHWAVLIAIITASTAVAQIFPQTPCPQSAPCPYPQYGQPPCQQPYRCCDCCVPNFQYWGHWPTVWRQWPQRRPDIQFPQGTGKEVLPTPEGALPEPLPKEEPFVSPIAPGGDYLPPIGEGSATGPGGINVPFDLNQGLDEGSGFDQGLPSMENLPSEPMTPDSLPIKGTDETELPPLPTPDSGGFNELPYDQDDQAVLTQQAAPDSPDSNVGSINEEEPGFEDKSNFEENHKSSSAGLSPFAVDDGDATSTSDVNTLARVSKQDPQEENPLEPVAPQPGDTCLASVAAVTQKTLPEDEQRAAGAKGWKARQANDTIRRTMFESPANSWLDQSQNDLAEAPLPEGLYPEEIGQTVSDPESEEPFIPVSGAAPVPPQSDKVTEDKHPPLGLDGYCPVELVNTESWTQGNERFAVEFEGRTYLMSGPVQHRAFRSHPERYAPANGGFDPVLTFEENVRRPGRTDACAVFAGRLYMFADADSLAQFQSDPHRYTRALKSTQKK